MSYLLSNRSQTTSLNKISSLAVLRIETFRIVCDSSPYWNAAQFVPFVPTSFHIMCGHPPGPLQMRAINLLEKHFQSSTRSDTNHNKCPQIYCLVLECCSSRDANAAAFPSSQAKIACCERTNSRPTPNVVMCNDRDRSHANDLTKTTETIAGCVEKVLVPSLNSYFLDY